MKWLSWLDSGLVVSLGYAARLRRFGTTGHLFGGHDHHVLRRRKHGAAGGEVWCSAGRSAEAAFTGIMCGHTAQTHPSARQLPRRLPRRGGLPRPSHRRCPRRTGSVRRIMQFVVSADEQPLQVFASREDAEQRLLHLATAAVALDESGQQAALRQPRVVRPAPRRP